MTAIADLIWPTAKCAFCACDDVIAVGNCCDNCHVGLHQAPTQARIAGNNYYCADCKCAIPLTITTRTAGMMALQHHGCKTKYKRPTGLPARAYAPAPHIKKERVRANRRVKLSDIITPENFVAYMRGDISLAKALK